jgi:predicted CopG family antitoxin
MGTTVAISHRTRELLAMLKTGEETYDDVITLLLSTHPNRLNWAELNRRFRSDEFEPVEEMLTESRTRRARGR